MPKIRREAPADLAALLSAHLACPPGREWGRTLLAIQQWAYGRQVRLYTTYYSDLGTICFSDSLPIVRRTVEPFQRREERR